CVVRAGPPGSGPPGGRCQAAARRTTWRTTGRTDAVHEAWFNSFWATGEERHTRNAARSHGPGAGRSRSGERPRLPRDPVLGGGGALAGGADDAGAQQAVGHPRPVGAPQREGVEIPVAAVPEAVVLQTPLLGHPEFAQHGDNCRVVAV